MSSKDHELDELNDAMVVCNPLTYGQKTNWSSTNAAARQTAAQEAEYASKLPNQFVLTDKRDQQRAFAAAAEAAKHPPRPLRPDTLDSPERKSDRGEQRLLPEEVVSNQQNARIPKAKRSNMDGVLRGIPRDSSELKSTQGDAYEYCNEMDRMNRDKNTEHFRKRDAYSEYVEARARFSKMHSVN